MKRILTTLCSLVLALAGVHLNAAPLGTAFTYQGRLNDGANPANGRYDLECTAYDAASLGNQIGSVVTNLAVAVSNGLFTVNLDFGANVFIGNARWLGVGVRSNGVMGSYTPLNPRQPLTPTPHAIYASTAGTVTNGAIQAGQLGTGGPPTTGQILSYNDGSLVWQTPGPANLWSVNNGSAYYNAGNVGIGTMSPSIYGHGGTAKILEINNSGTTIHSQAHLMLSSGVDSLLDSSIGTVTWAQPGGMAAFVAAHTRSAIPNDPAARLVFGTRNVGDGSAQERMAISENGNVGIGTGIPSAKLQVVQAGTGGVGVFVGDRSPGGQALYESDVSAPCTHAWFVENNERVFSIEAGGAGYFKGNVTAGSQLIVNGQLTAGHVNVSGNLDVGNSALSTSGLNEFTVQGIFDLASGDYRAPRLVVKQDGNVGIGTSTPTQALDVRDGPGQSGHIHVGGTGANGVPKLITFGDGDYVHIGENGTDDTMELKATRFVFTGGGVTVPVLTITGGADLAEPFPMKEERIEKGSVVVIDEEHPGQLKLSTRAHDTQVAGIVSGANGINPGIALHQEGALEGGQNVALSGRVYVQADASSGPIKPGDLLTTSDTPGHAMKVTDHAKAQGAIIGKAMSALKAGKGTVLVLVSLQ